MSQTPGSAMYLVGTVVLIAVGGYFAFMAINTIGLAEQEGTATVVGKEYHEAGSTYHTQVIDGRSYTQKQATPEMFVVKLETDGKQTAAAVEKELYESLREGDRVQVVYQRRRITGATQVLQVSR